MNKLILLTLVSLGWAASSLAAEFSGEIQKIGQPPESVLTIDGKEYGLTEDVKMLVTDRKIIDAGYLEVGLTVVYVIEHEADSMAVHAGQCRRHRGIGGAKPADRVC